MLGLQTVERGEVVVVRTAGRGGWARGWRKGWWVRIRWRGKWRREEAIGNAESARRVLK